MSNIKFVAVGGGDEIGASSYFLEQEGKKFILDVGIREKGSRKYPNYSLLKEKKLLDGL